MSRIYEALLKAEQDRATAKTEQATTAEGTAAGGTTAVDEVVEATAMPHPVMAPFASTAVTSTRIPEMAVRVGGIPDLMPAVTAVWRPKMTKLLALQSAGSHVEQFRSLRSKLFEFRDLNKLKTIMVGSGMPGEGKSFVALNLAVSFARHKSARVLLIDGDLRRSTQHKVLGAAHEPGLAEYLAGKATLGQVLYRGTDQEGAAFPPGLSTLTFIPSGEAGDRAADLSGSPLFGELIKTLSPQFDWIIVDSSPVNLVTDGVNLARSCDGVLLIARGGVTKYETAQRAITELKASEILGLVLNAVNDEDIPDNYYGYGGYDSLQA